MIYTYTKTFKVTAFQYIDENTVLPEWFKKTIVTGLDGLPFIDHYPYKSKSKKRLGELLFTTLSWLDSSKYKSAKTNDWVVTAGKRTYIVKDKEFRNYYTLCKR